MVFRDSWPNSRRTSSNHRPAACRALRRAVAFGVTSQRTKGAEEQIMLSLLKRLLGTAKATHTASEAPPPRSAQHPAPPGGGTLAPEEIPLPECSFGGWFKTDVVGESHYQPHIRSVYGRHATKGADPLAEQIQQWAAAKGVSLKGFVVVAARLFLEDQNPYDRNAVRVEVDGRTVGYLSREDAREYRRLLLGTGKPRAIGVCKARIRGGEGMLLGVALNIDLFDDRSWALPR